MPRRLAMLLLLVPLMAGGCDDDDEDGTPAPSPEPAPPPAPIAGTRAVATPAAFDLVAVEGGAALVWGPPANDGGGVRAIRLDALGGARGETVVVYAKQPTDVAPVPPDAVEISAASGGGRLVIGFAARLQPELHALATHGPETVEAFAPVEDLGTMAMDTTGGRGRIASAAGPDGRVAVMHRDGPAPCVAGEGEAGALDGAGGGAGSSEACVGFAIRRLGSRGGSSRSGVGLAAPSPCEGGGLVGYLWSNDTWHYGLCTAVGGAPVTTVYAIRFDPEYAHADRALEGCEPLGLVPTDDGAALIGGCADGSVGAVAFADVAQRRLDLPRAERAVTCRDGRPTLSMTAGERIARLSLGGPRSGLGAWLPGSVAPRGARAVWTGDAVLVAHPVARDVSLRRYQCVDGELVRTDTP